MAVDFSQPAGDGHQPPAGDHTFFGYGKGGVPPMLRVCSEARAGRATPRTAWRNISMAAERTTALGPAQCEAAAEPHTWSKLPAFPHTRGWHGSLLRECRALLASGRLPRTCTVDGKVQDPQGGFLCSSRSSPEKAGDSHRAPLRSHPRRVLGVKAPRRARRQRRPGKAAAGAVVRAASDAGEVDVVERR